MYALLYMRAKCRCWKCRLAGAPSLKLTLPLPRGRNAHNTLTIINQRPDYNQPKTRKTDLSRVRFEMHSEDSSVLLPSQRTLNANLDEGWKIGTDVRPSNIAAAGNGRYTSQAVVAGALMFSKKLRHVKTIKSLCDVSTDSTVVFHDTQDLETFIELCQKEGNHTRDKTLEEYQHYIYGYTGTTAHLNFCTWTINHGEPGQTENMKIAIIGDTIQGTAMRDIDVGEEIYNNYREFKIPAFYTEFCETHGFKDVRSAVMEAIGG